MLNLTAALAVWGGFAALSGAAMMWVKTEG